jgi:hypothetical protein
MLEVTWACLYRLDAADNDWVVNYRSCVSKQQLTNFNPGITIYGQNEPVFSPGCSYYCCKFIMRGIFRGECSMHRK